jgi:Ca2+-transporting ATPase
MDPSLRAYAAPYKRRTTPPPNGTGVRGRSSSPAPGALSQRGSPRPPREDEDGVPTPSAGYAYSTTLRRMSSPTRPLRPSLSMHDLANPYDGGPPADAASAFDDQSTLTKVVTFVRRVTGHRGYEEVQAEAREARERAERRQRETPSAVYAHKSVEETLADFHTDGEKGLASAAVGALVAQYGPNEFELPPDEPLWLKFAKQVYENPLILLLLGSSVVSGLMGNYDDAVCVVVAVAIVLTGE